LIEINAENTLRIIDVNLNRLREALRVIEEYFRFIVSDKDISSQLKLLRHSIEEMEKKFDIKELLSSRDTVADPFTGVNRNEEMYRKNDSDILRANFKRAQEAARVLEEYFKVTRMPQLSEKAKNVRFKVYSLEKGIMEKL